MLAPIAAFFAAALLAGAQDATPSRLAYVTVQNGVAVIDTAYATLLDTLEVCSAGTPAAVAIAAMGSRLYVPCLNEGVVKVVDRLSRATIATISVAPDSLHAKSAAVIKRDGSQIYITTKKGLVLADTTTNAIVARIALGPVSAVDFGPLGNHIQLQDGKVRSFDDGQFPAPYPVTDPNFLPPGPDQPIGHDANQSAWIRVDHAFIDVDGDPVAPVDDPFVVSAYTGLALPNSLINQVTALATANESPGSQGDAYAASGGTIWTHSLSAWVWRRVGLPAPSGGTSENWTTLVSTGGRVNSIGIAQEVQRMYTVDDVAGKVGVYNLQGGFVQQIALTGARAVTIPSPTVRVTIASSPAGQSFSLEGDGCPSGNYVTPRNLIWVPGSYCTVSFPVATSSTRQGFASWTDGVLAASRTISSIPATDITYTATFKTQYQLSASAIPGGSGSISGTGYYDAGSIATVSAIPAAGFQFTSWTGPVASASSSSTTIAMTGPVTVTANFHLATTTTVQSVSTAYSEQITLSATVGPPGSAFNGSLQFQVNGSNVASAMSITGGGTYTRTFVVGLPAGSYTITATLTSGTPYASGSNGAGTLTVAPTHLDIDSFIAPPVAVSIRGGVANSATLSGKLVPARAGGNLNLATATLTLVAAGPTAWTLTCPVTNSSSLLTATCRNVPVGAYNAQWQVAGGYFTGTGASVLAVYDPSARYIAGSGSVARAGGPAHFAVSVQYNPNGSVTGGIACVDRTATGQVAVMASTTAQFPALNGTTAIFGGPAKVNGVSGGKVGVTLTDNGYPGVNRDLYRIEFYSVSPDVTGVYAPLKITEGDILVKW